MINIFDGYELRARIFPAILVTSPLIFPSISLIDTLKLKIGETVYIVVIYMALIYLLSMLLRYKGKKFELSLWEKWGGEPAMQVLLGQDEHIGEITKKVLRKKIHKNFEIEIVPGDENEKKRITEAFKLVKALYNNESMGLIYKHNYEYGFLRNLYSGFHIWWLTALASIILSGTFFRFSFTNIHLFSLVIGVIYLLGILCISRRGLGKNAENSAFTYATTVWTCFYHWEPASK
jgi:hypothetical protein